MRLANPRTLLRAALLGWIVLLAGLDARETSATTAGPSGELSVVALSNGWPIKAFDLNNSGSVVFGGGQNPFGVDGLVLVNRDSFVKFAGFGDPAPGFAGEIFVGFLGQDVQIALNDQEEIVFGAACMACSGASNVWECFGRSIPIHHALFRYSGGRIDKIAATGDPAPGTGGRAFSYLHGLWLNNRGTILLMGDIAPADPQQPMDSGLFSVSAGRIEKVMLRSELTPLGDTFTDPTPTFFSDAGVITFVRANGVFRFANGQFIKVIARGNPAPGGGALVNILNANAADANMQGDIVFQAQFGPSLSESGLFLLRGQGTITRILAHGDPTPIGGTFNLWFAASNRGGTYQSPFPLSPKLNESGNLIFTAPVKSGSASQAIFLYTQGRIEKLLAPGDPGVSGTSLDFFDLSYTFNDLDMVALKSRLNNGFLGLFRIVRGQMTKLALAGDAAPGTDGATFAGNPRPFLLNASGDVAFQSSLCCGTWTEGIFLAALPHTSIPNGSFEALGDRNLPTNWQTVWNASGSGDAFRYDGAGSSAFKGTSVLRLHAYPGGGSTFVLSDPIPVAPDTVYLIGAQMRYYLTSNSDAVFFSVIQFDAADNVIGFDEASGRKGDNSWAWQQKALSIRTALNARSIRIRLGLSTAGESYLDVDEVH